MRGLLLLWSILIVTASSSPSFTNNNYGELAGHQIWKVDGRESAVPSKLMIEGFLDVLDHSGPSRRVKVAPHYIKKVQDVLEKEGLLYQVLVDDLAAHLEVEDKKERARRDISEDTEVCTESHCPQPLNKNYMTLEQMEWYLQALNKTYFPKVNLTSIGKSYEDRDIWLLHIKSDNSSAKSVWIEGGLHAREWISPAVSLGLISKLVSNENMRTNFDFFFAPMVNPDGYKYTWSTNRLWRKNRRKNANSKCDGVDLNRNWDFHFGTGASTSPCSEIYMGVSAFSEPETQVLRDAMLKEKDNLVLVLSLHSYGQELLYPWGWTHTRDAPNKAELIQAGEVFANGAEDGNGNHYSVINSAGGLYYASGATDDWAFGVMGTRYVYTLELRDEGHKGFILGTEDIQPTIDEVWNGFKKLLEHIV